MADEKDRGRIPELRDHLFATLRELRDPAATIDAERVKMTVEVSRQIIDTGRLEVSAMRASGAVLDSGFLPPPKALPPAGDDAEDDGLTEEQRRRLVAARARDKRREY